MPSAVDSDRTPISDDMIPAKPPDLSAKLPKLTSRRRPRKASTLSNPPPETPPLLDPPAFDSLAFMHPSRRIVSPQDHELFLASPTYTLIVSFIFTLSDSIEKIPISTVAQAPIPPTISSIISILDSIEANIASHPASDSNGSRFGNPIFRTFISSLSNSLPTEHTTHFSSLPPGAIDELSTYLLSSLGSPTRIDYGSGHELHFAIYLLCLFRLSLLPRAALPAAALLAFPRYLSLMRTLQATYYLEPAGSHGVWGLDDYHFLPFLLGASQLAHHPAVRPLAIHSQPLIDDYADDFLYLDMVRHVNATKTVQGLRWHSPMLDDISGVKEGWGKICGGMKKMFLREVLGKLVVMQHFLFGGLVPAVGGMSEEGGGDGGDEGRECGHAFEQELHEGHAHDGSGWDDCCGIKVPSSVGATLEMKKRLGGTTLRRLPFD